jgi:hypothetical protein
LDCHLFKVTVRQGLLFLLSIPLGDIFPILTEFLLFL